MLNHMSLHYVQCLKLSDNLVAYTFDDTIIAGQLRYAGVLEAVKISRIGHSQRYVQLSFMQRYRALAFKELKNEANKSVQGQCGTLVKAVAKLICNLTSFDETISKGRC
mmetsp:Transcript_17597/g.21570  ORF Transcript_17597/g.21570 Transcript_17597/m.21570 type:complete len:109 (+) Transcript_17597:289-615(+)